MAGRATIMTIDTTPSSDTTLSPKNGFLPIKTNTFDRYFISVVCFIAIHLLWLRFVEPMGLALWMATALSVVLGFIIVKWG